jgi:MFS family permease
MTSPGAAGSIRSRDFRALVLASGLSSLGDDLALTALTIRVHDTTDSGLAVAALLLAGLLPLVVFAPLSGLIADRVESTRLLKWVSLAQAGLSVALALTGSLPLMLVMVFVLGIGASLAAPASFTLVPAMVHPDEVTKANAWIETAKYAGWVVGPIAAGLLSTTLGVRAALFADAISFIVVALAAASFSTRRVPEVEEGGRTKGAARAGFSFIRREPLVLLAVAVTSAIVVFAAMDNVAEVFFATDTLGSDGLGYGVIVTGWAVGMVVGANVLGSRLRPERLASSMLAAAVWGGAAVAAAALIARYPAAVVLFVIGGVANGLQNVAMRSLLHHRTPDHLRGRVYTAYAGLVTAMQMGATAMGGIAVGALGAREAILVGGLGSAVAGAIGLLWFLRLPRDVRAMPEGVEAGSGTEMLERTPFEQGDPGVVPTIDR